MSIRVIIDNEAKVIDYEFFEREAKLKSNKNLASKEVEKWSNLIDTTISQKECKDCILSFSSACLVPTAKITMQ